jgi:hypothetical protein
MLSPRSRGKGGRRAPGRDGGRGKRKVVLWRKQALHAIEKFPRNSGELVGLTYFGPFGHSAAERIYLFDQRIAEIGVRYVAELCGSGKSSFFDLRVPAWSAERVSAIIVQIEKR